MTKDLDIKKIYDSKAENFLTLMKETSAQGKTTTDLRFILNLREAGINDGVDEKIVDDLLWPIMRDHRTLKVDGVGESLFLVSVSKGIESWYFKLVEQADLLEKDTAGFSLPYLAVLGGSLDIVKDLYNKECDFLTCPNKKTPIIQFASSSDSEDIFKWLLSTDLPRDNNELLINTIIHHNNPSIVEIIINNGVDFPSCNVEGLSITQVAMLRHKWNILNLLISSGANDDRPFEEGDTDTAMKFLYEEEKELSMLNQAHKNFSEYTLAMDNKDGKSFNRLILKTNDEKKIKALLGLFNINPLLDLNIDEFEDSVRDKILSSFF